MKNNNYNDHREFLRVFKKQPTRMLQSDYKNYNSDFRRVARQELRRRGATVPITKRKKRRQSNPYSFGFVPSARGLRW